MITLLLLVCGLTGDVPAGSEENPVARELIENGLELPGKGLVKLPAPTMRSGLSAKQQVAIIKKVADKHPYVEFIRKTDIAPHTFKISSVLGPDKQRKGLAIELYFVAYGPFQALAKDNQALDRLLGNTRNAEIGKGKAIFLTAAQLEKRAITLNAKVDEKYALLNFDLLDKVQVSGVGRSVKSGDAHSLMSAIELDPRFAKDDEFANQWRAIAKTKKLGPPNPYSGFGGYVKVTELTEPKGALFVEFHLVLQEPREWKGAFGGENILRSKFPLIIPERVKTFRRQARR